MPTLSEILRDPNYINANEATKRAIFERHAPLDQNYTGANQATQFAIRQRFGVEAFGAPVAPPPVASKERTFGEAAKDIAASVVSGAGSLVQLPGQLYGLATGNFADTGALGLGKDIRQYGEEMKSAGLKAREQERAQKIQTAEQKGQWEAFKTAFGETVKDPALLTSFLAEQAPQLLVPFGAARVAQIGTAAKATAAAQGLTGTAAKEAVEAVTKAAAERGTKAAIGAGAVQQGADVGSQAYEDIYKELIRKGASEPDAAQGAINLARAAGASGSIISLLAQRLPGARTLEESFAGVKGTSGRLVGALKGAAGEGASEIAEETGGKFGANLAMREVKPEQSLLEGLGQTAGMAAVGGVGLGGVAGALRTPGDRLEVINGKKFINGKPVEEEAPAPPVAPPAAEVPLVEEVPPAPTSVTPEFLTELGIKPTAAVARRIKGKSLDDPAVATELETYANKYATEESKPKILEFVQSLKPPVEPVAPPVEPAAEAPVAEAPVEPAAEVPPVAPVAEVPVPPAAEAPAAPPVAPAPPPVAAVEPSVAEDSELVTPAPVVEAAAPVVEEPAAPVESKKASDIFTPPTLDYRLKKRGGSTYIVPPVGKSFTKETRTALREWAENAGFFASSTGDNEIAVAAMTGGPTLDYIVDGVEEQRIGRAAEKERGNAKVAPIPAAPTVEAAAPKAEAPEAELTKLTIQIGGSDLTLDLGKPVWQATDEDLVQAVKDSGAYLGKPGSKYDPYMLWREAHNKAIQQAKREGKPFPAKVLYDKPRLIRDDLSDNQADEAIDAMVDVYRATKDYDRAVEAYRNFGKKAAAKTPVAPEAKSLGGERAQVQAFEQDLRTKLNKFGLKDVGLKILDGMTDSGSYAAQIIRIAADAANPVRTLRHEAIHALRELGFFTDAQWSSLSKMAKDKWVDQYLKQRNVDGKPLKAGEESRYDAYMREYNGDMEKITEEAVSDAFADFDATKPPAGMLQALLKRMKDLFQSIKSALTKVESPEQIFGKVEKGELKAGEKTEAGERKSVAAQKKIFDLSIPEDGNVLRDYKIGDTTITIDANANSKQVKVASVRTPVAKRGGGSARKAMQALIDQADQEGVKLYLDASSLDSRTNTRKLVEFYKSLRFKPTGVKINAVGDIEMAREAKGEAKSLRDRATTDIRKSIGGRNPGEQAISIVNQMKMGIPPAKATFGQQTIAILKGEQQLPTLDLKTAKEVAMKFSDTFEKNIFSADAAFENAVRRGVRKAVKDNDKVIGLVLQAGQSQTVNIDNVVSRGIIEGASEYNEDMQKWQSVQKEENLKAQTAKLEEISKKYNLPLDEVKSVAHAYLVTKRLPGILERNAKFTAEIDAEQKTAKPDRKKIEELKALLVMVTPEQQAQMEPGQSLVKLIPELEQVSDIWQGMRKNTINTMVEGGLWSREYAESLLDNVDYVPYYRVEQLEEDAGPLEFIRGLQVKAKDHRLKGSDSPVNDVFDNQVRWMQYAMSRAMRAHKARQMIDVAKDIDIGGRKMAVQVKEQERGMNIVRIYRDGKQELWDVADPNFIDAFAAIQNVSIQMFKWAAKAAEILRNTVVLYPLFSVAQVPQDSMAAVFTSGLKPQHALKIPYLAVQEFIKTIAKTSATHNELKKFGVVGARDFSADVMRKDAEIEAGLKQPKGVWGKTKEILEHVAMAGDNAVRQATYIASKQQGLSEKEALEKAFEIFNVRRRGTSKALNLAGQTIPFFYAYLAAQRVAYRTITGVGTSPTQREAALKTLAATSASVMVLSMIYAMMVGDDEDYAETPAAVRDRTLMIPGSGGVRIPLRPDFFLFPKIIAEHTYQLITDKGYEDGAKFRTSMFDALVNAVSSPTAIPQIVKPALEVAINYDFFQGKPLIGTFEKNKDLERQFRDTTSELAKLFGQTGMVSPIAVDHLIRGMLGSFGGLMLYGTNMFLHSDPDVPRPEMSWSEAAAALPGTAGFLKRPQESALKNDFFVLRDAVEKAANTFNDIKTRSPEGIQEFLEDEKNAIRLGMAKGVDKVNRHLSDIRRRMTIITNMPESQMPADEKAENIRELRELERAILRSVNVKELREMAKI